MNSRRILGQLTVAVGLIAALAGCVAAPSPLRVTLSYQTVTQPRVQLGIDVDFYTYPGQDIAATAREDVAYAKSLHANAISLSFPFFTPGRNSSVVEATDTTPSPTELATVVSVAEQAGLFVSLRPLLDEGPRSIDTSRTAWQPADQQAWFASYRKFLLPYAAMAQRTRVPEFIDGAEFTEFGGSSGWAALVSALRGVYKGTVVYANNWGIPLTGNGGPGVVESVDSYQPLKVPVHASLAQLTAGWQAYDRTLPAGTVETEIDIAAVPGAYAQPYQTNWRVTRLDPAIQTRWFTAACNAVADEHLGGLYFWAVGFGQSLDSPPSVTTSSSWVDGPGATAIASCFQKLTWPTSQS